MALTTAQGARDSAKLVLNFLEKNIVETQQVVYPFRVRWGAGEQLFPRSDENTILSLSTLPSGGGTWMMNSMSPFHRLPALTGDQRLFIRCLKGNYNPLLTTVAQGVQHHNTWLVDVIYGVRSVSLAAVAATAVASIAIVRTFDASNTDIFVGPIGSPTGTPAVRIGYNDKNGTALFTSVFTFGGTPGQTGAMYWADAVGGVSRINTIDVTGAGATGEVSVWMIARKVGLPHHDQRALRIGGEQTLACAVGSFSGDECFQFLHLPQVSSAGYALPNFNAQLVLGIA